MNNAIDYLFKVFKFGVFELRKGNFKLNDRHSRLHDYIALSDPLFYLEILINIH